VIQVINVSIKWINKFHNLKIKVYACFESMHIAPRVIPIPPIQYVILKLGLSSPEKKKIKKVHTNPAMGKPKSNLKEKKMFLRFFKFLEHDNKSR
jgi:hypothetical protein